MKRRTLTGGILLALGVSIGTALAQVQGLPFSPARQAGSTLYLSGQIAALPDGTMLKADIAAQTRQTMDNLGAVLKDNGYTFDDVVRVTVYLKDMEDYQAMNAAYREYFPNGFPARACVGGLQIAFGLDVEISAIAVKE
jgi:2-iminobutanoate/2-iminopropanoate deaminase